MYPILFNSNATEFSSNGIGRLSDTISYTVLEKRNGEFELTLIHPVDGIHFSDIANSNIIYAKPNDYSDNQAFRIYKVEKPISGKVTVHAEHISYQANYIPVMPFSGSSISDTFTKIKTYSTENNPFTLWTDIESYSATGYKEPLPMRTMLGGMEGSVLDTYGGEYEWDNWTIKLWNHRGSDNGVVLKYGVNLTDFNQEENIENTYTGLCPFWADSEGETLVTLPEKVLHAANAENFPFQRTVPMNFNDVYDEAPTVEQLRESAQRYMLANNIGVPSVSIKVSFVPLWQSEEFADYASLMKVKLCDIVTVQFEKLGVNVKAKVIGYEYDGLKERYISIEIGDARSSLAQTILAQNAAIGDVKVELEREMKNATDWMLNGNGYVVAVKNEEDGSWKELLFMDSPSMTTARKVLRINENGIGFSGNGVEGPYAQAWTLDGQLSIGGLNDAYGKFRILDEDGEISAVINKFGYEWTGYTAKQSGKGNIRYKVAQGSLGRAIELIAYDEGTENEIASLYLIPTQLLLEDSDNGREVELNTDTGVSAPFLSIGVKGGVSKTGDKSGVEISHDWIDMYDHNGDSINTIDDTGIHTMGVYWVNDGSGTAQSEGISLTIQNVVSNLDIDWDAQSADWTNTTLVFKGGIIV